MGTPASAIANILGGGVLQGVAKLIDVFIPDKTAAAAAKANLLQAEVQGELNEAIGQIQADTAEAASKSVFVAGWRPFVGWVCGFAFGYAFIFQPALQFAFAAFRHPIPTGSLPVLDVASMMPVLLGMLGLGAMRSFDKTQGTSNGH